MDTAAVGRAMTLAERARAALPASTLGDRRWQRGILHTFHAHKESSG